MKFRNVSPVSVIIQVDEREFYLNVHDTVEISCAPETAFVLKHTYKSTALSEKEIAADLSNDSLVSLAVAPYHEPFFRIALDGHYILHNETDSIILIQRHYLSPAYGVMYDRLYPIVDAQSSLSESYSFAEREAFIARYLNATGNSLPSKKVFATILKILAILAIPFLAFTTWRAGVLGFLGGSLLLGLAAVPCAIMWGLSKIGDSVDKKYILPHFQSEQIKRNFLKEQGSPTSRIEIG